jgi:transcriptional regulator with PAS, ATPase and Fis domain
MQERTIEPLGGVDSVKVNVRVVAATNRDLAALVQQGTFREDLYYRIRVIPLHIPSLRERREDIPLLVEHLVSKFNRLHDKTIAGVSGDVMARLMELDFPGNVRELENIIEQAFVLCRGELIEMHHLPVELRPVAAQAAGDGPMSLVAMERYIIEEALRRHGGNRKLAARQLGIDPSTLYRKMKALVIEPPEFDGRSRRR